VKSSHYKAFISYSHTDEKWARWLQNSLEGYRVPRRLVGTDGRFGRIPKRLAPVFRDREDLSSSADLTQSVRSELERSECLVVICSPRAAVSRWVNEEIRFFRKLGRGDRIYCLIVDGDPLADNPRENCFPRALLDGSDEQEPLAADARAYADGKRLAMLKLVAGILGIRLDQLRQRDMQRRRRTWALSGLSAAAVVVLTSVLALTAIDSRKDAQARRANTEELLSFMLGNLKNLDPIIGLEVIDTDDAQTRAYIADLEMAELDSEELIEAALQWRETGITHHTRGNLTDAMEEFLKSRAAFIELHQREEGSERARFELGQSEFWVGYTHMDLGNLDQAQVSFSRYGAITRRLINANPDDAEMVLELSYTLTNLGALERQRSNPDTNKALQLAQSAMEYNRLALLLEPENQVYKTELSTTMAFLADAWLEKCALGKAFEWRRQTVDLARELADERPYDNRLTKEYALALSGMSTVQRQMSLSGEAIQSLEESAQILTDLAARMDNSPMNRWDALDHHRRRASVLAGSGRPEEAWEVLAGLEVERTTLIDEGLDADIVVRTENARFLSQKGLLAAQIGRDQEARSMVDEAVSMLAEVVREKPENRVGRYELAHGIYAFWSVHKRLPPDNVMRLVSGYLADPSRVTSCKDTSLAAKLAVVNGDVGLAKAYTDKLLAKGYFDPEYIQFCRQFGLCEG